MNEKMPLKPGTNQVKVSRILKLDKSCISNSKFRNFGFEMQDLSDFQFPFYGTCGVQFSHVFQGGFDEPSIEIWSGGGTCVCRDSSLRATECAASSEGIRNGARSTVRFGAEFSETAAELVSR